MDQRRYMSPEEAELREKAEGWKAGGGLALFVTVVTEGVCVVSTALAPLYVEDNVARYMELNGLIYGTGASVVASVGLICTLYSRSLFSRAQQIATPPNRG